MVLRRADLEFRTVIAGVRVKLYLDLGLTGVIGLN